MGLDQYAWALTERPEKDTDFEVDVIDHDLQYPACFREDPVFGQLFVCKGDNRALAYWRKHPNLHGFIQDIYVRKGGSEFHMGSYAGPVVLDSEDIDAIEAATKEKRLPHTTGFFFGESGWTDHDRQTLEFCKRAREAIAEGKTVVYDSSW